MKEFFRESKYLIILWLICIFSLLIFCGHYSEFLIDIGREVYYPERILHGDILYHDLFNIYGPLSYQINAVLYKIFGIRLETLYGAGFVSSLLIVSGIYLIAQKFLTKFLSFCIGFFTITVGITTTSIFNFHFPYSCAMLYGLIGFLYSLYFLVKFEDEKKSIYLYLSSILAGFCVTCKYDFLLYTFVILYYIIKNRSWKALLYFISIPFLSFGILFLQGLRFSDLINSLLITKVMAKTKTLTYFYQNSGIYFHPKALITDLTLFLKCAIPFVGILFGVLKNKKLVIFISSILLIFLFDTKIGFGFLPIFLLILTVISGFQREKVCKRDLLLAISAFLVSAKVFWVLLLGSYGNYYVSIVLVGIFALLFKFLPQKMEKFTGICIFFLGILLLLNSTLPLNKFFVQTNKGKIFITKSVKSTNNLVEFINKNTKANDEIVIFPEGLIINFLTDRKSDGFYNSMLPLYIETFGEDKLIEHFELNKPEYIVFNNLNMKDYYYNYICKDYALKFCSFVKDNYELQEVIGNDFKYTVFKKMN